MSRMIAVTPRIGFDRFIKLEWATMALSLRAGLADHNDLNEILDLADTRPCREEEDAYGSESPMA